MEQRFQAAYKNGVLQPPESIRLKESQHVTVTIGDPARQALSTISGSLSETVIALRQGR